MSGGSAGRCPCPDSALICVFWDVLAHRGATSLERPACAAACQCTTRLGKYVQAMEGLVALDIYPFVGPHPGGAKELCAWLYHMLHARTANPGPGLHAKGQSHQLGCNESSCQNSTVMKGCVGILWDLCLATNSVLSSSLGRMLTDMSHATLNVELACCGHVAFAVSRYVSSGPVLACIIADSLQRMYPGALRCGNC